MFKPKGPSGLAAQLLRRMPTGGWRPPLIINTDDWEGKYGWNDDPRLGYGRLPELDCSRFTPPRPDSPQGQLF